MFGAAGTGVSVARMSNEQMAKDHSRDYRLKHSLLNARIMIDAYTELPGLWPKTHGEMQKVMALLKEQEDHIVHRWD
jgi:hypothetical protein